MSEKNDQNTVSLEIKDLDLDKIYGSNTEQPDSPNSTVEKTQYEKNFSKRWKKPQFTMEAINEIRQTQSVISNNFQFLDKRVDNVEKTVQELIRYVNTRIPWFSGWKLSTITYMVFQPSSMNNNAQSQNPIAPKGVQAETPVVHQFQ